MAKKVLITGGAGFLGANIARKLIKDKYNVRLFDRVSLSEKDLVGKTESLRGDIRSKTDVENAIKNCDYVVHAAAMLPPQKSKNLIFEINVKGTENVLRASLKNKIKRLVFISSTEVYGVPKNCPQSEDVGIVPIGAYGESKAIGEKLCQNYMKKGLSINILRPRTFLGPGRLGVFQKLFKSIFAGRRVIILGDGNNLFQLLAVSDLVDAVRKAMVSKVDTQIFNIGASDFGTWRKDLKFIIKYQKSISKIVGLPIFPLRIILPILNKLGLNFYDISHYESLIVPSYVSIEKAESLLKWHPKKSNREILLEGYEWYKNNMISK